VSVTASGELGGDDGQRAAGLALVAGLADAQHRDEAGAPGRRHLGAHLRVAFAMVLPALRMAEDHMAAADVLQHLRADVAGMRALRRGMAILAAERDPAAGQRRADQPEQRRRRAHQEFAAALLAAHALRQRIHQCPPVGA
jgi:hypothetical protein